ncbi:hypothetical protein [Lapillicoccus jejuensis]|uniref:SurA-like protein n=1 Tax=Lapillicoccus jejuensis TaxID=402171 RepID=A0A542E1H2_9MICO|nr:hypothetical protein [Lapillicoccus jejuensis]TQJ09201.1 hypothetical protein FB458_2309 [Lapillicoccus jejuensis]
MSATGPADGTMAREHVIPHARRTRRAARPEGPRMLPLPTRATEVGRAVPRRRRRAAVPALAAAGLVLLGGCSTVQKMNAVAVVDGQAVTADELTTATDQYNAFARAAGGTEATQTQILPYLVQSRIVVPWARSTGAWKPDASYAQVLSRVPSPAPETKDLFEAIVVSGQAAQGGLSESAAQSLQKAVQDADVTVNPRYGTFVRGLAPTVTPLSPNWITPGSTPTAQATAPAGQ